MDDDVAQSDLYAKMIKKARDCGMKIIGLDLLQDQFQQFDTCTADELLNTGQCTQSSHLVRNQIMATIIETVVRKGGRCVAFTHYYHAVKKYEFETGIKALLDRQGISTKTISAQWIVPFKHPASYVSGSPAYFSHGCMHFVRCCWGV